jgi:hypothetical protein
MSFFLIRFLRLDRYFEQSRQLTIQQGKLCLLLLLPMTAVAVQIYQ